MEYQNNNNYNNQGQAQGQQQTKQEEPKFRLQFDEQQEFKDLFATNIVGYTTSTELITLAKNLFGQYADFTGVGVNVTNNGFVYLTLRFDHLPHPGQICAFTNQVEDTNNHNNGVVNDAMEEIRRVMKLRSNNATRYHISQAGKDGLAPFMYYFCRNNNGNINWENNIYRDALSGNAPVTDVDWIDPCALIRAKCSGRAIPNDKNSAKVTYMLRVDKFIDQPNTNTVYQFAITQIIIDNLVPIGQTLGCAAVANDGFSYIQR